MARQRLKAGGAWLRLVTIVACAVASAGWAPSEWRELRGPGYEVQFPGNPSLKDMPFVLKAVTLKLKYYSDEPQPGRLNWSFASADLPASLAGVSAPDLFAAERVYATAIGGNVVKQAELSLDQGTSGTETAVELKNGLRLVRRLYVNGGRLYQLCVIHSGELDVTETFKRYAASLKLSSPAPRKDELIAVSEGSVSIGLPGHADRTLHDLTSGKDPVVMTRYQVPPDATGQDWQVSFVKLPPEMRQQARARPGELLADFRRWMTSQERITQEQPVQLRSWRGKHHGLLLQMEHGDGRRTLMGIYLVGEELFTLRTEAPKSAAVERTRTLFDRVADSIKPRG
jgi:hypothetical protein